MHPPLNPNGTTLTASPTGTRFARARIRVQESGHSASGTRCYRSHRRAPPKSSQSWGRLRVTAASGGCGVDTIGAEPALLSGADCPTLACQQMCTHRLWTNNVYNFLSVPQSSAPSAAVCLYTQPSPPTTRVFRRTTFWRKSQSVVPQQHLLGGLFSWRANPWVSPPAPIPPAPRRVSSTPHRFARLATSHFLSHEAVQYPAL